MKKAPNVSINHYNFIRKNKKCSLFVEPWILLIRIKSKARFFILLLNLNLINGCCVPNFVSVLTDAIVGCEHATCCRIHKGHS